MLLHPKVHNGPAFQGLRVKSLEAPDLPSPPMHAAPHFSLLGTGATPKLMSGEKQETVMIIWDQWLSTCDLGNPGDPVRGPFRRS